MSMLNILYGRIGSGVIVPSPSLLLYSDVSSSISSSSNIVSDWNGFSQSDPTKRPLLITDNITGLPAIRFDIGKFLTLPAGQADFLHQRACTLLLVWRQRIAVAAADQIILDSSGNGATPGYQLRALDAPGLGHYRQIRARIGDGSTWVIDHTSGGPFCNYMALKWNVTTIQTSATQHVLSVDHCEAFRDTFSVTLPSAGGGALTLGNAPIDVMAMEVWT